MALVRASPSRKDLSSSLIAEDLGFATPRYPDGAAALAAGRSPQCLAALRSSSSPKKPTPKKAIRKLTPPVPTADGGEPPSDDDDPSPSTSRTPRYQIIIKNKIRLKIYSFPRSVCSYKHSPVSFWNPGI